MHLTDIGISSIGFLALFGFLMFILIRLLCAELNYVYRLKI